MGFSLPQLNSCCCGCSLRTGTLIILWLYVVGSIFYLSAPFIVPTQTGNSTTPSSNTTPASTTGKVELKLDIFDVICTAINLVVGAVGLYAVYRELHLYLTPFLAWYAFYAIQEALRAIITHFTIEIILGQVIGILIAFYLWLVVFSHYRVLKGSARPIQA